MIQGSSMKNLKYIPYILTLFFVVACLTDEEGEGDEGCENPKKCQSETYVEDVPDDSLTLCGDIDIPHCGLNELITPFRSDSGCVERFDCVTNDRCDPLMSIKDIDCGEDAEPKLVGSPSTCVQYQCIPFEVECESNNSALTNLTITSDEPLTCVELFDGDGCYQNTKCIPFVKSNNND